MNSLMSTFFVGMKTQWTDGALRLTPNFTDDYALDCQRLKPWRGSAIRLLAMAGDQNDALLLNDRTETQASLRNFGLMGSYPCLNDGMPCLLFLQ